MCMKCPFLNYMTCPKGKSINGYRPCDLGTYCTDVHEKVARFVLCMFSLTNSLRTDDRFEKNGWCMFFPKERSEFVNCCSYVSSVLQSIAGINHDDQWYLSDKIYKSPQLYLIRNVNDFSALKTGAVLFCMNYEHILCPMIEKGQNMNEGQARSLLDNMVGTWTGPAVISKLASYGALPTHVMFYIDRLHLFGLSDRHIGGMNHPNGTDGIYTVQSLGFNNGFAHFPRKYILIGWNW